MAIWEQTTLGNLATQGRWDSEYYQPEYLAIATALDKEVHPRLGTLARTTCSAFYPAATGFYQKEGMPFIRCVDVNENPVIRGSQPFERIPESFVREHGSIRTLQPGDIVISKVGSPCYASILDHTTGEVALTRTVLGLHSIRTERVDPYYLVAFLRSKYGFYQLLREREQQIQLQLTLDRVRKIRVHLPDLSTQRLIGNLIRQHGDALQQAEDLYDEAASLLAKVLKLDQLTLSHPVGYEARLSEVRAARRFDGEYFKPSFRQIVDCVFRYRHGYEPLLRHVQEIRPNVDPRRFPDELFRYIELADINASLGLITSAAEVVGRDAPSRARRRIAKDDVLISAVVGSIDKAALVGEKFEDALASTGFFQFRSATYDPRYLLVLLRCKAIRMQLEREATGGILSAVSQRRLRHVIIPTIPPDIQEAIAEKVGESHSTYRKAELLLEKAKRRVEEMIEQETAA
jgi:hypothetical protein